MKLGQQTDNTKYKQKMCKKEVAYKKKKEKKRKLVINVDIL